MRFASIDIGTNSIRLLISEYDGSSFHTLERRMETARLGKNLDIAGNISKISAGAALKALGSYCRLMDKYDVKKYRAVGTNALRKASNSGWFISYVEENTGVKIDRISGREEAELSFMGAASALKKGCRILVVDIGGGSTELIIGSRDLEIELYESIDIGSVSISERFIRTEKPTAGELKDMQGYIKDRIKPFVRKIDNKGELVLVGVAGTITTLAAIDLGLEQYDSSRIHHHILTDKKVQSIYKMLCGLGLKRRKRVMGLQPERADIIIGGTAVLVEIMDLLGAGSITVSEHDILDGIIYSLNKF
jgi:exopolyphosphatase / guanosine-5'-triphosphate,3'-diphosphate pyrophosphatase